MFTMTRRFVHIISSLMSTQLFISNYVLVEELVEVQEQQTYTH